MPIRLLLILATLPAVCGAVQPPMPAPPTVVPIDVAETPEPKAAEASPLVERFDRHFGDKLILLTDDNAALVGRLLDADSVLVPTAGLERFLQEELRRRDRSQTPWFLTGLELDGVIGADRVRFDGTATVRVNRPEGAVVDLKLDEARFTSATTADGAAPDLEKVADGPYRLHLAQAGAVTLRFSFFVEVQRDSGDNRVSLTLPEAAYRTVRLRADTPIENLRNRSDDRRLETPNADRDTALLLGADQPLDLSWENVAVAGESAPQAAIRSAVAEVVHSLSLESLQTQATVVVTPEGPLEQCVLRVDPAEEILALTVRDLSGRPVALTGPAEGERGELRLRFAQVQTTPVTVQVRTRRPVDPDEPVELAGWETAEAVEQSGRVLVAADDALDVRPLRREGLIAIDAAATAGGVSDGETAALRRVRPRLAFRFFGRPVTLTVQVRPGEPVLTAAARTTLTVRAESLRLEQQLTVQVRRGRIEEIVLRVPANLSDSLRVGPPELFLMPPTPTPTRRSRLAGGAPRRLVLPLAEPMDGTIPLELTATAPLSGPGSYRQEIPTLAGVPTGGSLVVRTAENVAATTDPSGTSGLDPAPEDDSAAQRRWLLGGGAPLWAFDLTRLPGTVRLHATGTVTPDATGADVRTRWHLTASREPLGSLSVTLPAGVGEVTLTGDGMAPTTLAGADSPARTVSVPVAEGQFGMSVEANYRSDGPGPVPLVGPADMGRQDWRLTLDAPKTVRVALPWSMSAGGSEAPLVEWKGAAGPVPPLTWTDQPAVGLAAAVAAETTVEEVLAAEGGRWGRKVQRLTDLRVAALDLRVPAGVTLDGIAVDGIAIDPLATAAGDVFRVPLPAAGGPLTVAIRYREQPRTSALAGSLGWAFGRHELRCPEWTDEVSTDRVRWRLSLAADRLALLADPADEHFAWRYGILTAGRRRDAPLDGTRLWTADRWGRSDRFDVWVVHRPLWLLVQSAVLLLAFFGLWGLGSRGRLVAAMVLATGLLVAAAAVPHWLRAWWLGAQWGAFVASAAVMLAVAGALLRRRMPNAAAGSAVPLPPPWWGRAFSPGRFGGESVDGADGRLLTTVGPRPAGKAASESLKAGTP